MAKGDKTKIQAFNMWQEGRSLDEVQNEIENDPTTSTKPSSIRGWVKDWERGRQNTWDSKF